MTNFTRVLKMQISRYIALILALILAPAGTVLAVQVSPTTNVSTGTSTYSFTTGDDILS